MTRWPHTAAMLLVGTIACSSHGAATSTATPPAPSAAAATPPALARPPAAHPPVRAFQLSIDSMVGQPAFRNAHWGILIVDPDRGDTLYSHNALKLFLPASNMKIVTGAVALTQLGPDFRFRTTFVATGPIRSGVLEGDLVVDGRGDPSMSDHMRGDAATPFREVADSLRAHGVSQIAGRIVAGDRAFPDATLGFGWAWDDLGEDYSAGVDDLYLNEGISELIVHGGRAPGSRARVETRPSKSYPPVDARGVSTARGESSLHTAVDSATGVVAITGTIAPGTVDTLTWVYRDQRAAYVHALADALREDHITVASHTVHRSSAAGGRPVPGGADPAPRRGETLFVYRSPPLRDILAAMEKPSQNQIAEVLLKTLGLERSGVGSADSGRAVVERQLIAWGAAPDGFVIRDGSGLSRYDYVSPETIVRVLAAMRRDSAFTVFYDALPIAGVDGTIERRMRGTAAQGNVHAKTGFVANARSLSGYVTTPAGRQLVFSLLCNNWTVPVTRVEEVQDSIAIRLASLPAP